MKQLLILGDSVCHGLETATDHKSEANTQHAFGYHIAKHLNLEYVNLAEPGSSIIRAMQVGQQYINRFRAEIGMIIIGWTHSHRIDYHATDTSLMINSRFMYLGDQNAENTHVMNKNNVRFVTDDNHKHHASVLPDIHQILVSNDFFKSQSEVAEMMIPCYCAWLNSINVNFYDFDIFGTLHTHKTKLGITFGDVMTNTQQHPDRAEHQAFAELIKDKL